MSTPLSIGTPPRHQQQRKPKTDDEMKKQMQLMIDLQYEQQQYALNSPPSNSQPPMRPKGRSGSSSPKTSNESSTGPSTGPGLLAPILPTMSTISDTSYHNLYSFADDSDVEVGQGTLSTSNLITNQVEEDSKPSTPSSPSKALSTSMQFLHLTSYGAVDNAAASSTLQGPASSPKLRGSSTSAALATMQPSVEHEFHYGNPDYHDPYRSGILGALAGLNILHNNSDPRARAWAVALTAAACLAESSCMALGHVWSAHVVAVAQSKERVAARKSLQSRKAYAKGQFVDILLQRGMLKIDAMSMADTLEGYPDLFVAALTGESWTTPLPEENSLREGGHANGSANAVHFSLRNIASYGRLTEYDMDPEALAVHQAMREAQGESIFMLLGFTLFAVVPSLLFWSMPLHDSALSMTTSNSRVHTSSSRTGPEASTSPVTVVVMLTCCVMWCLGIWKSRFVDSNWVVFGIEAVVVLLICVTISFGVGYILLNGVLSTTLVLQDTVGYSGDL
ncbi:predicted protein [Phaeodactylum tricornutum CCAP 1055/1]|uniref:Uncharacterized protein n=2 Tax=Phaeodactylum tricornutum TaxID=2850 RepID=B7G8G2_PHATC|nr:predicted protein [Phaeodactylum tricornutum CCAP 1055/1]EEC45040.1 predicted protein [Phaeodactylum tricornutum CCAP 1055/1]|eukprot:XP_002183340.1 predicted protein [Phaeodactylum tricornutum CCAP 1055/1]